MRKIDKGTEPQTLTKYRASIPLKDRGRRDIYNDFKEKTIKGCESNESGNLRKQLLEEQGYVCCYCLSRISCSDSKIEHFRSQENHKDLRIDYKNLFISCKGGVPGNLHCDTKKANKELSSVDLLSSIENRISYKPTGRIMSKDPSFEHDINEILNLNSPNLIDNRKQSYSDLIVLIIKSLPKTKKKGDSNVWKRSKIQSIINKYESKNKSGQYAPHFDMLIFFLKKRLNRL